MKNCISKDAKRRFWEKHVEQWKSSGLTTHEYCLKSRIKLRTFRDWKRKISGDGAQVELVELTLQNLPVSTPESSPRLCVVVNHNFRIEIEKGFDPEELERVVSILRRI